MHAEAFAAVEIERLVGLEEMIVAADLDRPVAGVDHLERRLAPSGIELDVAVAGDDLAGHHLVLRRLALAGRIGSWTVTSLVPSGKVPSTWIIGMRCGDAGHHVVGGEQRRAAGDQVGHRAAFARAFQDLVDDDRRRPRDD